MSYFLADPELKAIFDSYDKDHDGVVTGAELMAGFDLNKDGKVSFDEFKKVISKYRGDLKKLFDSYDKNKDGHVDAKELLQEFDLNKDGKVSFEEFKTVLKKYKDIDDDHLKQKFTSMDKDKNGTLEPAELLCEFDLNKDGKVTFDEFKKVINKFKGEGSLKKRFDSYDKNHDGFLDASELLREFDLNKDSKISFDEFKKVWPKFH